jgi:hypothetical protein
MSLRTAFAIATTAVSTGVAFSWASIAIEIEGWLPVFVAYRQRTWIHSHGRLATEIGCISQRHEAFLSGGISAIG